MTDSLSSPADTDTDIAIIGMAGRFPGARNVSEYWANLRDGVESLTRFTDEELLAAGVPAEQLRDPNYVKVGAVLPDMEGFDAPFFGFSPREAAIMDPQHRHFLMCAWQALEDAGHVPARFPGNIGVFGGSGHNLYLPYNLLTHPKLLSSVGFFLLRHTGNDKDFLTTRVSYLLDLKGPSVNVQTACSTSLVAIHTATQSLLNGECDMALAGGVTIELPHRHGYTYREGEILSPDGHCHAFDAGSQGTVFSSAVGVVVLRRLADALADGDHIHAVIKGSAINNDGAMKVGYMAPSVDGQAKAIAEALAISNVEPHTITYVEAHGTGTPVGDPIELAALTQAFRQGTDAVGYCGIGSVKSSIGHTDTAAGVASFIKVALALQHGQLPPTLHFSAPNPACHFDTSPFYVNDRLKPWQPVGMPRRAGVSSLGVGGTNAHVVLEQAPVVQPSGPSRPFQPLVVSARTATALDANTQALAAHLQAHPDLNLADVAHTLQVGRQAMRHRRVLVAASVSDAVQQLSPLDAKRVWTAQAPDAAAPVAFLFAGGGAQYPGMGQDLYDAEPVYRAAMDECLAHIAADMPGVDWRGLLYPAREQRDAVRAELERPSRALPLLFATQYALARLWMSWGVEPAAMIGHSMGEYTAAHLAGVFSLRDGLRLVALRGRLFETLPEGGMLSVPLPEADVVAMMPDGLSVAAVNGSSLTVIAGLVALIDQLQQALAAQDVEAARVRISVAAHSSMLEPILQPFEQFLRGVAFQAPQRPFVSNLSGTWITAEEATDPTYWVRHLRQTVRFADGLQELLKDEHQVLLEVGPGRTLASLARQHPARAARQPVLNAMRHADEAVSDQAYAIGVLGRLWAHGVDVDWSRWRGDERRQRLSLPAYQFDLQRHWIEPGQVTLQAGDDATAELRRRDDVADWFHKPVWRVREGVDATQAQAPVTALVLADGRGMGEALAGRVRHHGGQAVLVMPGASYARLDRDRYQVRPTSPDDFALVLAALAVDGRPVQRIFHLWGVTDMAEALDTADAVRAWLPAGLYSLIALAQAAAQEDLTEDASLTVVTNRAQRIAGDRAVVPAKATLAGAAAVIPQELPQLRCLCVDVDRLDAPNRQRVRLLDALLAEAAAGTDDLVAYRGGERWVRGFEPHSVPQPPSRAPVWRERGVYLVTGGLGGIGRALAALMARQVQARLVLLGRSALPPREQWAVLQAHEPDSALARRVRDIQALEAQGAQVMVETADVTDVAALRAVLRRVRMRWGAVHGVLHTAGVIDDGIIPMKSLDGLTRVLAPKVQGTLALQAALAAEQAEDPPDFMVLFSSISAFAGLAGQVDYAAANAFLDAYAQASWAQGDTQVLSMGWSQWQDVGMAAEMARELGLPGAAGPAAIGADGAGTGASHPAPTHPWLQQLLASSAVGQVFATRFSPQAHWLLDEHRLARGDALIPGTGYLEIVRAALATRPGGGALVLRDLSFLSPFGVADGSEREMRVQVTEPGAPGADIRYTVTGSSDGTHWVEHVRGRAQWRADAPPATLDLAQLRARCSEFSHVVTGQEPDTHLRFGPRWRNVQRIDYGQDEALAQLRLPDAYAGDLQALVLHPALMDMATAGAQALIPGYEEQRDFYVPASYGELVCHAALPQTVYSHIRLRSEDTPGAPEPADVVEFDIALADEQGQVLVEIRAFTMMRLHGAQWGGQGAAAAAQADAAAGTVAAEPSAAQADAGHLTQAPAPAVASQAALANPMLALGAREGIRVAEALAVIERALASGEPHWVVTPHPLDAVLQALRQRPSSARTERAADAAEADPNWAEPDTVAEKLIAQMWGDMLGVARVSATDNFFDLGGHSLLAVQVINKIKKHTGKVLPLTALLEAPTVEELAAMIEPRTGPRVKAAAAAETAAGDAATGAGADAAAGATAAATTATAAVTGSAAAAAPATHPEAVNKTLIRIRAGQGRLPVFLVHDGNGETLLYRTLAYKLHAQHAVYGLNPAMRADGSYIHTRLADMAAAHIQAMRGVQPHGPYLITGLCAGGVIAFEVARQLQDAGERTLFVGIMDAGAVGAAERPFRVAQERLQRFVSTLTEGDTEGSTLGRLGRAIPKMLRKVRNVAVYEVQSRLERSRNARKLEALRQMDQQPEPTRQQAPAQVDPHGEAPGLAFMRMYEIAHHEHVDHGRFEGGDVVLYRATQGDPAIDGDLPFKYVYSEPLMGWDRRVVGSVIAADVPGGHSSMLQEPHVSALAQVMQGHIDAAVAKAAAAGVAMQAGSMAVAATAAKPTAPAAAKPDAQRAPAEVE